MYLVGPLASLSIPVVQGGFGLAPESEYMLMGIKINLKYIKWSILNSQVYTGPMNEYDQFRGVLS